AHRPERTVVAHREATVDHLVGLVLDTADVAGAPRVVDQDVDAAEVGDGGGDHALDLLAVGHVDIEEASADLVGDGLAGGLVDLCDEHAGTLGGEAPRDAGADAVTATGDHRDAAGKTSLSHDAHPVRRLPSA